MDVDMQQKASFRARSECASERESAIANWLLNYVANLVQRRLEEIDDLVPLAHYGVDSVAAVSLSGALEDWLGTEVDPVLAYDYPTIRAIAAHLAQELEAQASGSAA